MAYILENIGARIRDYRTKKRMTQQELAEHCDLSLPYINFIENGHRTVSLPTLIKILEVLDVSLSDFFLPFSSTTNADIANLLMEIQKNDQTDELAKHLLEIVKIANKN